MNGSGLDFEMLLKWMLSEIMECVSFVFRGGVLRCLKGGEQKELRFELWLTTTFTFNGFW